MIGPTAQNGPGDAIDRAGASTPVPAAPRAVAAGIDRLPHIIECRRNLASPWLRFAVAPDRAVATQRLRELLALGVEARIVPLFPPERGRLHADDVVALHVAARAGTVNAGALARALGDASRQTVRVRASNAIRRCREAAMLRPSDALDGHGFHRLTDRGRAALAAESSSATPRGTVHRHASDTPRETPAGAEQ
jgi:hypothetical protein